MSATTTLTDSVMLNLKENTADLHRAVETHPLQVALFGGRLPRQAYAAFLGQMWWVHRSLEGELRGCRDTEPTVRGVVHDYQFREASLAEDLAFFGVRPGTVGPLASTRALIASIEMLAARSPWALLGMQYVLEGSTNGGKFIAQRVRVAYELPGPDGLRYLDPYGADQRMRWQAFKDDMNAQDFDAGQQDALVAAAKEMFAGMGAICEELWRECQ